MKIKNLKREEDMLLDINEGTLTLKGPNKNCSRRHFNFFFTFIEALIFHVNPLPSRGFT